MITCKVGDSIINCFDGQYDKYKLKTWSNQDRLICPDCGKSYEYCHGEVVSPYFRHKEKSKECDEIYHEPETEEHIKGKTAIYKWLLSIRDECGLQNIHLEHYIKETRQKPDVYFEQDGKRYAIEYQCTPIATEFINRRELYKLACINDIWILGCEKYTGRKFIEKHVALSYSVKFNSVIFKDIKGIVTHNRFLQYMPNTFELDNMVFKDGRFNADKFISEDMRDKYVTTLLDDMFSKKSLREIFTKKELKRLSVCEVVDTLNGLSMSNHQTIKNIEFHNKPYMSSPYDMRVDFNGFADDEYVVFIKEDVFDVCMYERSKFRRYTNLMSCSYRDIDCLQTKLFNAIIEALDKSATHKPIKRLVNVLNKNKEKIRKCVFDATGITSCNVSVSMCEIRLWDTKFGFDISIKPIEIACEENGVILDDYVGFENKISGFLTKHISNIKTNTLEELQKSVKNKLTYRKSIISVNHEINCMEVVFLNNTWKKIKFDILVDANRSTLSYHYIDREYILDCKNTVTLFFMTNYLIDRFININANWGEYKWLNPIHIRDIL